MKKIMVLFLLIIASYAHAQVSGIIRGGMAKKITSPFFALSANFSAHNIAVGPEMLVQTNTDEPANFGAHVSYQFKFIEIGAARYFQLYTTDAEFRYKNGWRNSVFVALHYKQYFMQYDYLRGNYFSLGFKF